MIQRIQSVFLVLLAICMLVLLVVPIWEKTDINSGAHFVLNAFGLHQTTADGAQATTTSQGPMLIALLAIAAVAVAVYEIFQYKNRLRQMKLGFLNTLLLAATLGLALYYSSYVGEEMVASTEPGSFKIGFFLPAAALFLNVLANRFIKRDEDLVRSVDRLR